MPEDTETSETRRDVQLAVRWATVAVFAVVALVPIIGDQLRVQDADPQFMRLIVERMHSFGGAIYENGIYNKGWLEPITYDVARHIGGYNGMWFVISLFTALVAGICAFAAARTVRWTGAPTALAFAVAAVVYFHLTLTGADYAGVLYARNLTVALLSIAWVITFEERCWRTPRARLISALVLGASLGIVVQALLTEAIAAAAIALAALALLAQRAARDERVKLFVASSGAALLALLLPPLWYAVRGRLTEFWTSWYGHAQVMSKGTGRSLLGQFGLGWDQLYRYYQQRPLGFLVIVAFVVFTYAMWTAATRRERVMRLALIGWLTASWLEQFLNQRYSSHYFVINTVPTVLMAAILVGHLGRVAMRNQRLARTAFVWPLIAIFGVVYLSGAKEFLDAVKRTSKFNSVSQTAKERADNQAGPTRSVRGVLDLVSHRDDAILAWTNDSWPYLDVDRVPAGRFIWKSFLMGEVYLGKTGPQYVLPHTWRWFKDDVARTKPVAFVKTGQDPVQGTAFADLVTNRFKDIFGGKQTVYLRDDVAGAVVDPPGDGKPWSGLEAVQSGSGWTLERDAARYGQSTRAQDSDAVPLSRQRCFRLDGTISAGDQGGMPAVDFRFDPSGAGDADLKVEPLHLRLNGDKASSASDGVEYESLPSGIDPGATSKSFSLVVGRRAAALVIDGQVRAAMRLPSPVIVSMVPKGSSLALTDLRLSPPPRGSGC
jgi:hypothetical protein